MLKAVNLTKKYGQLEILKGISLEVNTGEIVSITGSSGAGKTTLLQILGTLDRPDDGTFTIDGINPFTLSQGELAKFRNRKIGFVFQFHYLLSEFTVLENVMIGASKSASSGLISSALGLSGRDEERLKQRSMTALERVYASGIADMRADSLPYPVTKRVAIARALVSEPKILLLDEPAGGLGSSDIEWMNSLIHNLASQCSIILVEHHMDVVMSVCDRLYVLNFGQVIASGDVETVRRDEAVVAAYLGVNN